MKATKLIIAAAILALSSCTGQQGQQQENNEQQQVEADGTPRIAPLPASVKVDALTDCEVPAAFTTDDFDWMGGNLTMTVYSEDLYDAVQVNELKEGDIVVYEGKEIEVKTIARDGRFVEINGGMGEENGASLAAGEGGTYHGASFDDHSTYTELGKAQLPLAEDFVIEDCGVEPLDPVTTIKTGQKQYFEKLEDYRQHFSALDTKVTVENGVITKITRRWIP